MKIVFTANGRCASAVVEPAGQPITAGSRGVPAEIHLSPEYDGLVVTAFFRSEYGAWPVVLSETPDTVTIPWEAMEKKSLTFDVGVVGKNGDGTIVIPTIWARAGKIVPATEDSGLEPGDPSADIGAQIVEQARAAAKKAEDAAVAAEEARDKMPRIVDGTWRVYNAVTESWEDTGIQAEGQDGVGISSAVLNANYTLTLTFTDGSSYTTPPIRGAQGERGPIGPTPDISIGAVTTGAAGSQADATMTGTPERPVLNLTIPRGNPGEVTQTEFDELADEVANQKSALASQYPDQNTFVDADVLLYVPYYGYVAKTTSSWQGNYPDTELEAVEGEKFSVMVSDYHATGNQKIRIQFLDGNGTVLKNVYPTFDEHNRVSHTVTAPANTAKVMLSAWTISNNASPVVGEEYYFKNLLFVKGDIYAQNFKVRANAIEDGAVSYNNLSNNAKSYYIGLRYGVKYPNFDTASKTLTFYAGTCIFDRNGMEISRLEETYVLQCNTGAQQNIIAFDRTQSKYVALRPAAKTVDDRYIILGMIQIAGSAAWPFGRGWIGIPHTIDGYDPYIKTPDPMWDLPDAWSRKVQDIQSAQGNKFCFAIQTDTHYALDSDAYYGNNLKALTNHVGFDFVANLGDIIKGYADEITDSPENTRAAMTQIMRRYVTGISSPLLVAMGNHDTNKMWADTFSGEPFDLSEVWAREFRPAFNTNTKAVTKTGLMYYYTDYDDIRVIVLDTQDGGNGAFGIGQTQIAWLTNTALNTDKAILVLSHVPIVDGWSVTSNYVSSYANAVSAIKAFQTNGGTVIGCMSGHTHTQESKTVDGILYVTFRNGANLCEVVQIDLDAKTINTILVGFTGAGNRSFTFV